jgi:glycosyltransferase involved in cell wall biosynthesis
VDSFHFDEQSNEWVIKKRSESDREYLARVEQKANREIDVLITFPFYGNIFNYTTYAQFDPKCVYLLYAFDVNGILGMNIAFTPKLYNYLKYPLKKAILQRVDRLLVEFSPIAEYVASEEPSIDVESFTPILSSDTREPNDSKRGNEKEEINSVSVTIPGMIDSTRRNYDDVLEALNILPEKQKEQIELTLLGKPVNNYGSTIIEQAKNLQSDGMELEYYTDWIPTDTFNQKLRSTDFLISPLRRQRSIDGFVEQYGKSKGSGALSDAISYATPLLLPCWFEVPEQTKPGIHTYQDVSDLQRTLSDLIENESHRQEWFDDAQKMSRRYSKPKQRERLRQIIGQNKFISND